ncbi:hypothetical protein MAH1_26020 [Sessilibacter sp. MAH1]
MHHITMFCANYAVISATCAHCVSVYLYENIYSKFTKKIFDNSFIKHFEHFLAKIKSYLLKLIRS